MTRIENQYRLEYQELNKIIETLEPSTQKILKDINGNIYTVLIGMTDFNMDVAEIKTNDGDSFLELSEMIKNVLSLKKEEIEKLFEGNGLGHGTNANFRLLKEKDKELSVKKIIK